MSVFHNNALIGAGAGTTGEAPAPAGYVIPKSLRFSEDDSAHLKKTPSTAGNRVTWSWSAWVKRTKSSVGSTYQTIFSAGANGNNNSAIVFDNSDRLEIWNVVGNANVTQKITSRKFRDFSSWYHFVVSATSSTLKLYVNGSEVTDWATDNEPGGENWSFSSANAHYLGHYWDGGSNFKGDFLLADVQFVDGQALAPTDFGETRSSDGVWVPKEYTGGYGLITVDEATGGVPILNTTGSYGGTVGSGTRTDSNSSSIVLALPMNGSDGGTTFTDSHATIKGSGSAKTITAYGDAQTRTINDNYYGSSGFFDGSGDYLASTETDIGNFGTGDFTVEYWCKNNSTQPSPNYSPQVGTLADTTPGGTWRVGTFQSNGKLTLATHDGTNFGDVTFNSINYNDDVWHHFCVQRSSGTVTAYVDGVSIGTATVNTNFNATKPLQIGREGYSPTYYSGYIQDLRIYKGTAKYSGNFVVPRRTTNGFHLNFSDSSTNEALGFDSASTAPDPDPKKGMDVITYTGTGAVQNIGGLRFEPGLVWIKSRGSASDHELYDSVRGATKRLFSSLNSAESAQSAGLTAFNPDGFTLGGHAGSGGSSTNYVAWTWRAGGPAVANTDGTATTQVSANTNYGFSICTFTSPASGNFTFGHGLNAAPKLVLVKTRGATSDWSVYHASVVDTTSKYLVLNSTAAVATYSTIWGSALPTSSVVGLTSGGAVATSQTCVAYCWSEITGFSKFGTYSGGKAYQQISTGFKPAFLLIKRTDVANSWLIFDNERGVSNLLRAESSNAEFAASGGNDEIEFLADGFELVSTNNGINGSGGTYIYMAFADRPGNDWNVNNIVTNEGLTTSKTQFDVVTYAGNGGTQSIDSLAFQPDLAWIKNRTVARNHVLFDSIRGTDTVLSSNLTDDESGFGGTGYVTAFNSDGFTVGAQSSVNESSQSFVAWCWKAGGTAVSNTDGAVTASVSANAAYGFSIVKWTSTSTSGTESVGHGLGKRPAMVIFKERDRSSDWYVWHQSVCDADTKFLKLNSTDVLQSGAGDVWGDLPTENVININNGSLNATGSDNIAYCFTDVPGYQRFGTYTGNGTSTGPVIVTGFKPRFILFKRTNSARDWEIYDTERSGDSNTKALYPASNSVEGGNAGPIKINSDGFQPLTNSGSNNGSGDTYIYWAIGDDEIGSDEDCLVDVPNAVTADADATDTTGGYQRGNYATLNPLDSPTGNFGTLTNGNLDFVGSSNAYHSLRATISIPSTGKWYYESTSNGTAYSPRSSGSQYSAIGFVKTNVAISSITDGNSNWLGDNGYGLNFSGTRVDLHGTEIDGGDVVGVAIDRDANTYEYFVNGVSTASGTIGVASGTDLSPFVFVYGSSYTDRTVNFGQMRFKYPIPSGYAALNTTALPAATVEDGSEYFVANTHTGNGSTQSITGLSFSPDLVWIKQRNSAADHNLFDIVRGVQKRLFSNSTSAEGTISSGLTAFNSDGWTMGSSGNINGSSNTYVGWAWDAGSSTASNTDGSITSSVRANPSAGFSIVSWTGTGSAGTIGHGLNSVPELIIGKNTGNTTSWMVGAAAANDWSKVLFLNSTSALTTNGNFNSTAPTSSVFSVGTGSGLNQNTKAHIAYCFTPVAGYSAFGSYTGNGSSDGPFVFTGFRVAFLMWKLSSASGGHWNIEDNGRSPVNPVTVSLRANTNEADLTTSQGQIVDLLSNGFKVKNTSGQHNTSGETYIYMAFAENPFQANGGLAR